MSISDNTLSVDVWNTVRSVLVEASIKITNTTTAGTKTASVLASYNDKKPSVPQIIIQPIDSDESEYKFGSSNGRKFINVTIECYYQNTLGVDQLSDGSKAAIREACEDGTITGMDLVGVTETYAFTDPNQTKFHLKTVTFTFDRE